MPCQNGATCLDSGVLPEVSFDAHGYKCNCLPGFIGKNCEGTFRLLIHYFVSFISIFLFPDGMILTIIYPR